MASSQPARHTSFDRKDRAYAWRRAGSKTKAGITRDPALRRDKAAVKQNSIETLQCDRKALEKKRTFPSWPLTELILRLASKNRFNAKTLININ